MAGSRYSDWRSALLAAALVAPQRSGAPRPAGRRGPAGSILCCGERSPGSSLRREQHRWAIGKSACGGALRVSSDALPVCLGARCVRWEPSSRRLLSRFTHWGGHGGMGIGWPVLPGHALRLRMRGQALHCGMAVFALWLMGRNWREILGSAAAVLTPTVLFRGSVRGMTGHEQLFAPWYGTWSTWDIWCCRWPSITNNSGLFAGRDGVWCGSRSTHGGRLPGVARAVAR